MPSNVIAPIAPNKDHFQRFERPSISPSREGFENLIGTGHFPRWEVLEYLEEMWSEVKLLRQWHAHMTNAFPSYSHGTADRPLIGETIGLAGPITDSAHDALETFWEYAAFVANSLVFILIGFRVAYGDFGSVAWATLVAIVCLIAGRALAIYGCCALFRGSPARVAAADQHVLVWGGLRGALALALALGLPSDLPGASVIVTVSLGVVAFSILAQGLTIAPLMRRLGVLPA